MGGEALRLADFALGDGDWSPCIQSVFLRSESMKDGNGKPRVKPRRPVIDINGPGWVRSPEILALFGFSYSTLGSRIKDGSFPAPRKDGRSNYWPTEVIRRLLDSQGPPG
jgi:predicted DNA-binding transcriptional regulator AlpA